MNTYKIISIILIISITGCSSIPHNKPVIYDYKLNEKDNLNKHKTDDNNVVSINKNYKSEEIKTIFKRSENVTLEECVTESEKDLKTVLEILNNESTEPLTDISNGRVVLVYENKQFKVQQIQCSKSDKKNVYVYTMTIDSKTEAGMSAMKKVGYALMLIVISPILLVFGVIGIVIYGFVNGVLYLEKVANEP